MLLIWSCAVFVTYLASLTYFILARRHEERARALLAETVALVNAITAALTSASPGAVDAALETQARHEAVRVFEEQAENLGSIQ